MIVVKDLGCFSERDLVILFVRASFLRIPFEDKHGYSNGNLTSNGAPK